MKKIIILATLVLTLTSCEDFLTVTPQDSIVADNYYTSVERLRANTASLYGAPWYGFQDRLMWLAGDQMAGDIYYIYDQEGHFYYNQVGAGNSFNYGGWNGLYRVVSYANSIINDMPPAARANGLPERDINQALAEARFIRAAAYFFLTEYWSEVPIIENSTALITSGNLFVNRHTQSSLYRFMCEDLEFAEQWLPATPYQPGRVTVWSARGMLAKIYLTRATYEQNQAYFDKAKSYAEDVIENSGLTLWPNYSTLFDCLANNNPESLFAIQCMVGDYGQGNTRTTNWSRSDRIADQQWGGGKAPTYSLQTLFEPGDVRRQATFMTAVGGTVLNGNWSGDYYPNLATAEGGYRYHLVYRNPDDLEIVEPSNELLAHLKKYCIGLSADNGGNTDRNQNAANNVYVLRLADVYMIYAEATMGMSNATSDGRALGYINAVRHRAGLSPSTDLTSVTFEQLIRERRKEFALEGINWKDIKRMYYRNAQSAINYLNNMERDRVYRLDAPTVSMTTAERYVYENNRSNYILSWHTIADPTDPNSARVNNIVFTEASMKLPIPAAVTTVAPILLEPAVDYYSN